jgi:hypothetical protein
MTQKRPEPDEATLAEIEKLDPEQRQILENVLQQHPTLSHKKALDHLKAGGL